MAALRAAAVLAFALISTVPSARAQALPPPLAVGEGRFFTTEGWSVRFSGLRFESADSVRYRPLGRGAPRLVPAATLLRVQRRDGDEAPKCAAIGAVSGAIGGALGAWLAAATINALADGTGSSRVENESGYVAVGAAQFAVVGAALGWWEGARAPRYVTVYEDPALRRAPRDE